MDSQIYQTEGNASRGAGEREGAARTYTQTQSDKGKAALDAENHQKTFGFDLGNLFGATADISPRMAIC